MPAGGMAGQSGASGSSGASGTVVLLTGVASADSSEANHPASHAIDGMTATRWCAANGATNHYWTLDLGSVRSLARFEVIWEYPTQAAGLPYGYAVSISNDAETFTPAIDRSTTSDTMQIQTSDFPPSTRARHVRVTVSSLPPSTWASFFEARVFGQ
jgi:alpha-L-fucosidase